MSKFIAAQSNENFYRCFHTMENAVTFYGHQHPTQTVIGFQTTELEFFPDDKGYQGALSNGAFVGKSGVAMLTVNVVQFENEMAA